MSEHLTSLAIEAFETVATADDSIEQALLGLLALIQRRDAYDDAKLNPLHAVVDISNEILLGFSSIRRFRNQSLSLSPRLSLIVKRNDKGYVVTIDGDGVPADIEPLRRFRYDVCISFAGENRALALSIAEELRTLHRSVFYDEFESSNLWGQDLFRHLYKIYSSECLFALIIFSKEYENKKWTNHELRAVFSRMLDEKGDSYVLPVVVDQTPLPPELRQLSYIRSPDWSPARIASTLNDKVWEKVHTEWLNAKEMAEVISQGARLSAFFAVFYKAALKLKSRKSRSSYILLGLSVGITMSHSHFRFLAVIEYLMYAFDPISQMFDRENELKVGPLKGTLRRNLGPSGAYFVSRQLFELVKAEMPPSMIKDDGDDNYE